MSVLLPIAPSRVGLVKVVCPKQPQQAYNRERSCNTAQCRQYLAMCGSAESIHFVKLHEQALTGHGRMG